MPDWHFEWHTQQDQQDIYARIKMMECLICHGGVTFDGFFVTAASGGSTAKRDIRNAAQWARHQNKSLRIYLQTTEGQPYIGFWTQPEVDAADQEAAAKD